MPGMSLSPVPRAVDRLVVELQGVFGPRLRSVAVYGGDVHPGDAHAVEDDRTHTLVIVDDLGPAELRACASLAGTWRSRGLATPLLLTQAELRRSLDAFPMEFDRMLEAHAVAFGEDPLAGLAIAPADLRRACEAQARSHALHLRESYLECAAEPRALARLIAASAGPFRALVAATARLHGEEPPRDAAGVARLARLVSFEASVVTDVLAIAGGRDLSAVDAEATFPRYLEAVETLVRHVDAWRG